jgi:hypothetical protein
VADNRESIFNGFGGIPGSVFSPDGVKQAAAWYIDMNERLANQAVAFQENATSWAKNTPFAPLIEAQNSFARMLVQVSANMARSLWQIQPAQ